MGCPARARTSGLRLPGRREPEGARTAPDRFRGSPEPGPPGLLNRAAGCDGAWRRPPSSSAARMWRGRARHCRDRGRRPSRQLGGDLLARQTVGIAVAHDRVLRGRPAPPWLRAMKAKLLGAQSQRVRAAPESSRKCIDTVRRTPLGAQHGVVRGYVAAGDGPAETELPSTMPNLLHGPAKVSRERFGRQTAPAASRSSASSTADQGRTERRRGRPSAARRADTASSDRPIARAMTASGSPA